MTKGNGLPCKKCGTAKWDRQGHCRECKRRYREANRDSAIDYARRYREDNPNKVNEGIRRWQRDNPDRVKEAARRYREANREGEREYTRRYRKEHPEKAKEMTRRWFQANREKTVVYNNRRRTRITQAGGSYTATEWQALCDHYGNRCLRCGRSDVKLTVDHVLPVSMGGSSNLDNLQPLCKSCNSWKGDRHIDFRTKPGVLRWIQQRLLG